MLNNDQIFSKKAKTFYLASVFFPKKIKNDVKILYNFCRYVDDVGDLIQNTNLKKIQLRKIRNDIKKNKSRDTFVYEFLNIVNLYKIERKIVYDLIDGIYFDAGSVNIKSEEQLEEYAYKVAGTVGLMMCSIMGVSNRNLFNHAIELGIAMQITNICRDIKEDLMINRIYFPERIRGFQYEGNLELLRNKEKQQILSKNILKLLNKSDLLYKDSLKGTMQLPLRIRFVILCASKLYQEIGNCIKKNPMQIWRERIFVRLPKKCLIILVCFVQCLFSLIRNFSHRERNSSKNYYEKFYSKRK